MEEVFRYIIFSAISLAVLYLSYLFYRAREYRFYNLRVYLLFIVLLALIIPGIRLNLDYNRFFGSRNTSNMEISVTDQSFTGAEAIAPNDVFPEETLETGVRRIDFDRMLVRIYLLGAIIILFHFLFRLASIQRMVSRSERINDNEPYLLTNKTVSVPFSFFRYIIIPQDLMEKEAYKGIVLHESAHARQYHSLDIVLIELVSILLWFNPVIWFIKKDFQTIHEYLADESVLNQGIDKLQYQLSLLDQVAEGSLFQLSSRFNSSIIKKRIVMMKTTKPTKRFNLKSLALLPLSFILILGISSATDVSAENPDRIAIVVDAGHGGRDPGAVSGDITEKDLALSLANLLSERADHEKYRIVLTRNDDKFLALQDRLDIVEKEDPDLFISLHINNHKDNGISGVNCYVGDESGHRELATSIGKEFLNQLRSIEELKCGESIEYADYVILQNDVCPSVFLNIGYLSNAGDLDYLVSANNQLEICERILAGIEKISFQ